MRIVHERYKCIGCGACVNICPSLFKMDSDGKISLKGLDIEHNKEIDREIKIIKEAGCANEAVEICPVECIHIEE